MKAIPVNMPDLADADRLAVIACLESGWLSSEGPQVPEFERAFARAFGRDAGVAVSSGTAALDIAVRALGLGAGDEVLVPSLTIISCAQAIVDSGATPVPVDCDPVDWNAHLRHFEERLTERTRAVLVVHLYGLCADLDPILTWARAHRLAIIEDASQAQGLQYKGRLCGSFGDVSVFSLYANKVITTGEGGMILCDAHGLAEQCRRLPNLCFEPARRFWHRELGWNYRMTAMQAALGTPQVARLADLARRKRAIGSGTLNGRSSDGDRCCQEVCRGTFMRNRADAARPTTAFHHYAAWYDAFNQNKDYAAEAKYVLGHVEALAGRPQRWLDIGCGTGRHLAWLHGRGVAVEGVDASAAMMARARSAHPDIAFTWARPRISILRVTAMW